MTKLLATLLLPLMIIQASPARAAETAPDETMYEVLGVPMTQKRIAIGAAVAVGIGVAAIGAVIAESLAIGAGTGFLATFALFEFLTLPVEAGVAAYLWPEDEEEEGLDTRAPPVPRGGS